MAAMRLDQAMVARGLAPSRAKAVEAIEAGLVTVDGVPAQRPAQPVAPGQTVRAGAPYPWVSRGGVKLAHALDAFAVDPTGRVCLDLGASTGGFTDVLLARGASLVFAVDVGRGQLHPSLRGDRRVVAFEGCDARTLDRTQITTPPRLIVADVSFISLAKALPAALSLAGVGVGDVAAPNVAQAVDIVALVKPQFEGGPGPAPNDARAGEIAAAAAAQIGALGGVSVCGLIESPIRGGAGAREFLLHARGARIGDQ